MSSTIDQSTFAPTMMESEAGDADVGSYGYLGRYRLDRMIGHGAMGAVFEAFDDTLGRTIAIKTLYTQSDDTQNGFSRAAIDAAILQEARTAATLNHPHIVTVFDAGRGMSTMLKRELPYVAMELLQGIDLRERITQGPALGQREAVSLVGKVAIALDHAHKAGVLHRDIKPANIFITKSSGPKILDFGLAKFTARATQAANITNSDVVAGSPQYMSPELVRSISHSSQKVDERSDVYSLGVILYELLCGKKPFTAPTLELLQEQISQTAPELPHVANPAVPRDLSVILMNTLAKKPEDRYRSAGQLSRELRRWGAASAEQDPDATVVQWATSPVPLANEVEDITAPAPLETASAVPTTIASPAAETFTPAAKSSKALPFVAIAVASFVAMGAALWFWVAKPGAKPPAQPAPPLAAKPLAPSLPSATAASALSPGESLVESSKPGVNASASVPAATSATAAMPAPIKTVETGPALLSIAASTASAAVAPSTPEPAKTPAATPASAADDKPGKSLASLLETSPTSTTPTASTATTGRVRLNLNPWGMVEVDGKKMGVSPPLTMLTLEPGEHTVTVRNSDFAARTFRVKIEAGKTERVSHKFE
jgi:eukaryotic-like serine/threonine-protein kinase